jgi:hypothetical protein
MAQAKDADSEWMTEQEMADALEVTVTTLRKKRYRESDHPPYFKHGATIKYHRAGYREWVDQHMVRPSEAEPTP